MFSIQFMEWWHITLEGVIKNSMAEFKLCFQQFKASLQLNISYVEFPRSSTVYISPFVLCATRSAFALKKELILHVYS